MAGSAELVRLVDLAETGALAPESLPKPWNFHHRSPVFFNITGFLEIFTSFYGIFIGEAGKC